MVESNNRTVIFVEDCSEVYVIKDGVTDNLRSQADIASPASRILLAPGTGDPMWDFMSTARVNETPRRV